MDTASLFNYNENLKKNGNESFFFKEKKVINGVSDLQLWQEFKSGSESAFATIYKNHAAKLYSYGLKLVRNEDLVKDSIQDLFVDIWNSKDKLANVTSIKGYLYKSIRRKLIREATKQRKFFDNTKDISNLLSSTPSAEFNLIEKQHFDRDCKILKKHIATLSQKQKEIIHLKFYANLSYEDIMEVMSLDKKATYNLMSRTVKILRKQMKFSLIFLMLLFSF
ncbi:RNA polymerase sigma factor [Polaribacter cellanae]|uniref:Sigma-70 family RNA polymerase sigma factor n=1 Tax=Polaribacter cellanae TaxID=2818493 RepID=A0A975CPY5_9FLAO|nr:sigma-70 family RNA polymerase sigma factor [Polaribacter cellanae]QTE22565.1 sigma-70 family RNA polymerase sigma factor [Polaribacter cellanae]